MEIEGLIEWRYILFWKQQKKPQMKQLCCELNTSYRAAEMEKKIAGIKIFCFIKEKLLSFYHGVKPFAWNIYLTSKFFIGPKSPKYSDSIKTKLLHYWSA